LFVVVLGVHCGIYKSSYNISNRESFCVATQIIFRQIKFWQQINLQNDLFPQIKAFLTFFESWVTIQSEQEQRALLQHVLEHRNEFGAGLKSTRDCGFSPACTMTAEDSRNQLEEGIKEKDKQFHVSCYITFM
jgi:hypothetical protein